MFRSDAASASTDSDRVLARRSRSVYQSVAGKVSKLSDRVTSGVGKAKERLTRSGRLDGGSLQQPAGGTPVVPGRRSVPVPHTEGHKALFVEEVVYETPRLIGTRRDKGLLIINGAEMAIIRLQAQGPASSSSIGPATSGDSFMTAGSSDTAVATVLVQHQLSKLIAVRQEGKVLSLEFARSTSAKFTCKAEAFGFNCDDLSPAAAAAAAVAAAERSGSSDSELARGYSPPMSARSGLTYDPADFAPGTSPSGLEVSASAASLGLEGNSYSSSSRDGMEFAMQYFKESRTLKTVKGLASSIRSKGAAEEEEGEGPTRRLRAPNGREYRIQIDDFRLSFNDTTCAELALKLMQAGRQRMLKALSWLKRGLPFTQDSEISHVTEADAYRGGAEVLLSGPTLWGTQLQLPPGWAEAVLGAEQPEDGLTLQDLQVAQGPAAFKVYLSTPAGMAVAHLTPGLLADIWHSSSREGDILAVPVGANLTQIQQQQQQQQQQVGASQPSARPTSRPHSAAVAAAAAEGSDQGVSSTDLLAKQPTGASSGRHTLAYGTNGSSTTAVAASSSGLDDCNGSNGTVSPGRPAPQRPGPLLQPTCSFRVGQLEDIMAGQAAGNGPSAAGAAAVMASVVGELDGSTSSSSRHAGQGPQERQAAGPNSVAGLSGNGQPLTPQPKSSSSSARTGTHYRRASMPAIGGTGPDMPATTEAAAGASDDSLLQQVAAEGRPLGRSKSDRALCDTAAKAAAAASAAGSGNSSPRGKSRLGAHSSSSKHLGEVSGGSSSSLAAAAAAAAVGSTSSSSRGRGPQGSEPGATSSSTFDIQASFADVSEVFAVIKVRMYTVDDESAEVSAGESGGGWAAGGTDDGQDDSLSPFAVAAGGSPRKPDGIGQGRTPSVIRSHSVTSALQVPLGRQASAASSGGASRRDAYGAMCGSLSGLLPDGDMPDDAASTSLQPVKSVVLHSTSGARPSSATAVGMGPASQQQAWSMLSTAAVLLCLASMLTGGLTTLLGRGLLVGAVALNLLLLVTSWRPQLLLQLQQGAMRLAGASRHKGATIQQRLLRNTSLRRTVSSAAASSTGQPSGGQAVHLELIRAVFVRDSMGLLEKQQIMYRTVYGLGAAERQMTAEEVEQLRAASGGLEGGDLDSLVVLISDPEPEWMTRDWKRRLIVARPTQEEREALARNVHQFRTKFQVATLLSRPPSHWATFQAAFHYVLLGMSPQGSPVLLLKVAMLGALPGELKRAGRTLEEFAEHMAFVWSFMFQELAPAPHPGGRYILLVDLGGVRSLSHMSACKVAGNHLGEVMGAFPERLCRCMVVNAPSWFNLMWRLVSPCLAEKTRAKVQVLTSEQEVVEELGRSVGPDWVPAEYGGTCRLPYTQYPVQQQLNKYAAQLATAAN